MATTSHGREIEPAPPGPNPVVVAPDGITAWQQYRSLRAAEVRLRRQARRGDSPYLEQAMADQRTKVLEQRNTLVESKLPVLIHVAERLSMKLPTFVERDELIQAGVPALIQAVERYRPAFGYKFETFAVPRLRGGILDTLRTADTVPRLARQRNRAIAEAKERFLKTHGRSPSPEELAECLPQYEPSERNRILAEKPIPALLSTEMAVTSGANSDARRLGEGLADDRTTNPLTAAERDDLKRFLTQHLPRREKLIIILYYFENMTMMEVATTLGISESRVSQTLKPLLEQIRAKIEHRRDAIEKP